MRTESGSGWSLIPFFFFFFFTTTRGRGWVGGGSGPFRRATTVFTDSPLIGMRSFQSHLTLRTLFFFFYNKAGNVMSGRVQSQQGDHYSVRDECLGWGGVPSGGHRFASSQLADAQTGGGQLAVSPQVARLPVYFNQSRPPPRHNSPRENLFLCRIFSIRFILCLVGVCRLCSRDMYVCSMLLRPISKGLSCLPRLPYFSACRAPSPPGLIMRQGGGTCLCSSMFSREQQAQITNHWLSFSSAHYVAGSTLFLIRIFC